MLAFHPLLLLSARCILPFHWLSFTEGTAASALEPIPPLQDPWYSATPGLEAQEPGAVLRIRDAPGNLASLVTGCAAAYNILYRTTNSLYKPDWAVTTVFVPAAPASALLTYLIPYDSVFLDASPSYAIYGINGNNTLDVHEISVALSKGWWVNLPDYEGPLASFTAGVVSGHATIDSVRATFHANKTHDGRLAAEPRSAMWGYSGGALAAEWAAELQVQYAPEVNFSGAALGGLTPNVTSVLFTINKSVAVGLSTAGTLGLATQYPDVLAYLKSRLKTDGPFNATGYLAAFHFTLAQAIQTYALHDIGQYFLGGLGDISGPEVSRVRNRDGIMGYHGVPQMPVFAYKAINDEISAIKETDALVERYCNIGANILYNRNTVGGHLDERINGRPAALAWLTSVLTGTYGQNYSIFSATHCTIQNVTLNSTDSQFRTRNIGWGVSG